MPNSNNTNTEAQAQPSVNGVKQTEFLEREYDTEKTISAGRHMISYEVLQSINQSSSLFFFYL